MSCYRLHSRSRAISPPPGKQRRCTQGRVCKAVRAQRAQVRDVQALSVSHFPSRPNQAVIQAPDSAISEIARRRQRGYRRRVILPKSIGISCRRRMRPRRKGLLSIPLTKRSWRFLLSLAQRSGNSFQRTKGGLKHGESGQGVSISPRHHLVCRVTARAVDGTSPHPGKKQNHGFGAQASWPAFQPVLGHLLRVDSATPGLIAGGTVP